MPDEKQINVQVDLPILAEALFAIIECMRMDAHLQDTEPTFPAQSRLWIAGSMILTQRPAESLVGQLMQRLIAPPDSQKEHDELKERMRAKGLRVVSSESAEARQD